MSEWKKVKLKDCCTKIGSGSTPKGGSTVYIDSGTSLIRSQNVYNLFFDYNGLTHITEEAAKKLNGVTIHPNDILLNITGDSVARTCIVPAEVLPARVNQHVAIVRVDDNKMYSRYLSYYLASPKMQAHMLGLAVGKGASRNAMTKQMIENFEVPCPPLDTQIHIATILSRYDSLIENYQKQIKLLEEAAQRLYKEWFVDLRFPGHENTKIVDGVPEGWEKKRLIDIAKLKAGGDKPEVFSKVKTSELKIPIFSNGTIDDGLYGYTDIAEINNQCVTISARGSVGYTVLRRKPFVPIVRLISVVPSNIYVGYLYYFIKGMPIESNGAAQQQITVPMIKNKEVIIPTDIILDSFKEKEESYFIAIENYKEQIISLSEARDRLLPKLMSGEIAI